MKKYLFPKKIYYGRDGNKSITPCPHGGSIAGKDSFFYRPGIFSPDVKVGSGACENCDFNKGLECGFVWCNRKPTKN